MAAHAAHVRLAKKLLAQIDAGEPSFGGVGEVPASRYLSAERFERERAAIFARVPVVAMHESALGAPGACATVEVAGVPLIVARGADGVVRAFKNACRHRSTRLVTCGAPCNKKAFVCPYHGWTYDLTGRLIHVPHEAAFAGGFLESRRGLVEAHAATRHGFVWIGLEPFDLAAVLGGIDGELESADLARSTLYRTSERDVRGNWKLVIDAFLDGYHIRHLHRDTVYRFFVDGRSEAEQVGPHIRAATARRALLESRDVENAMDLRQLVTPSYFVFPNVIVILHPDYASVLTAVPLAANRTRFTHTMLVADRASQSEEHWAKSFELIDQGVFVSEDLEIVEAMQAGLESGANESVLFGALEHASLWFHEAVDARLRD